MDEPALPGAESGLVKICGVASEPGLHAAVEAGADLIGLVFVERSARHVSLEAARQLAGMPRGGAALVGLFQDPALSEIEEVLEHAPLDVIQLHGRESHDDVARIGASFALPVIRAVGVATRGDLYEAAGCPADLMVYDARPPEGSAARGGHGAAFDWSVLAGVQHGRPWLLAGGLTPDNVVGAIEACAGIEGFAGVDVSSGVEASPGVKDAEAVTRFAARARAAMGALRQS